MRNSLSYIGKVCYQRVGEWKLYMKEHTHINTHAHAHARTHAGTRARAHTHTHTDTYRHIHIVYRNTIRSSFLNFVSVRN